MIPYKLNWQDASGCPRLFLAPMEGVGDRFFRRALAQVGGFDEASTEFLRVPRQACGKTIEHLASLYNPLETAPIPQAAQVMGGEPELLAQIAEKLTLKGAPRIDLNCGCPSNTVVGRGAGSSLLQDPELLYQALLALTKATPRPVTAKIRAGYSDTSLFKEIVLAAEAAGIAFLVLHPRTKVQGYSGQADWQLIARAKQLLRIPVVGSGDILTVADGLRMQRETGCDGLMIGRGAVSNPLIFLALKAHYRQIPFQPQFEQVAAFVRHFASLWEGQIGERGYVNKLKQLFSYLFLATPQLQQVRLQVLTLKDSPPLFLEKALSCLQSHF